MSISLPYIYTPQTVYVLVICPHVGKPRQRVYTTLTDARKAHNRVREHDGSSVITQCQLPTMGQVIA